ncbi:MAG: dephospho-CoA kinase [Lentisphaerae bacterium]|nr:dephospho-CoA kinase [Lentisphaerota bacterium]
MKNLRICVTGGIACGKSTVGNFLKKRGYHIVDADSVCHELQETPEIISRITSAFGDNLLTNDKKICRKILADIVFNDSDRLVTLNNIMHPAARKAIDKIFDDNKKENKQMPIAIIPLVYEAGWEKDWDVIVCVAAPHSLQITRLQERGLSEKEAQKRIDSQMPLQKKMALADYVIFNSGTLKCLEEQIKEIFG